jgi:DUF2997 family protein
MGTRQEIVFVIRRDGTVEEQVTGVAGPKCEEVTQAVEQALGDVVKRESSSEYFDQQSGETATVDSRG